MMDIALVGIQLWKVRWLEGGVVGVGGWSLWRGGLVVI